MSEHAQGYGNAQVITRHLQVHTSRVCVTAELEVGCILRTNCKKREGQIEASQSWKRGSRSSEEPGDPSQSFLRTGQARVSPLILTKLVLQIPCLP